MNEGGNGLVGTIPTSFGSLEKLRVLWLRKLQ